MLIFLIFTHKRYPTTGKSVLSWFKFWRGSTGEWWACCSTTTTSAKAPAILRVTLLWRPFTANWRSRDTSRSTKVSTRQIAVSTSPNCCSTLASDHEVSPSGSQLSFSYTIPFTAVYTMYRVHYPATTSVTGKNDRDFYNLLFFRCSLFLMATFNYFLAFPLLFPLCKT